jgi:YVTN family beta-propeller protein
MLFKNAFRQSWPLALLSLAVLFANCSQDEPAPFTGNEPFDNGVLVLNEGTFSSPSSLSFFFEYSLSVQNEVFNLQNDGALLGQLAQSISEWNEEYFIMVSNSNKVEILNKNDLTTKAVITDIELPRYFLGLSDTEACISYWSADGLDGGVAFVNLADYSVTETITTGNGPENMLEKDGKLYVANAGGFGKDSTVTVIDLANRAITDTIVVLDGPAFLYDIYDEIYVLCKGVYEPSINDLTPGGMARIRNDAVSATTLMNGYPDKLILGGTEAGGTDLYFLRSDGIYEMTIVDGIAGLPIDEKIVTGSYYGLGFDAENNQLLLGNAGDFATPGWMVRCELDGERVDSFPVGIAPNYFLTK